MARDALQLLAASSLKAAFILALAFAAMPLLRRLSAAARHWIWFLALLGVLIMPILAAVIPSFSLPVLPAAIDGGATTNPDSGSTSRPVNLAALPAQQIHAPSNPSSADTTGIRQSDERTLGMFPAVNIDWSLALLLIWFGGALLIVACWSRQMMAIWQLARRGTPIADPILDDAARTLGINDEVRLVLSDQAVTPLTWGLRRPIILLPLRADEWPDERRRIVLLHELAHVARGDYVMQWFVLLACAVNWFNPLVWRAAGRAAIERERACDDRVLDAGIGGAEYASHLLEIARLVLSQRRTAIPSAVVTMVSGFERRIRAILDHRQSRRALSRRGGMIAALLCAGVVLPLGGIRLSPVALATQTAVPPRAGIIAGHSGIAAYGPTQGQTDPGSVCSDGFSETSVTMAVARQAVALLQAQGITVDVLEEFDPRLDHYEADALVALHTGPCEPSRHGFQVTHSYTRDNAYDAGLDACLYNRYGAATHLPFSASVAEMQTLSQYHAFFQIAPTTPGAILQLGQLSKDRALLHDHTDLVARGVADGLLCFLKPPAPTSIQALAEAELHDAVQRYGATGGQVLIMDPRTGAVLALAYTPTDDRYFTNPVISDVYEPGTVFRIVTASVALQSGKVTPDWTYYDHSPYIVGGLSIYNWDRASHGSQTFTDIMIRSWNIGTAHLAVEAMGPKIFYDGLKAFGVGERTGIDLEDEANGIVRRPGDTYWADSDLATNSFGQALAVTPLQMLVFTNAVANGGTIMQPYVHGSAPRVHRTPLSPEAARTMTDIMVKIVNVGEGRAARVKGYTIAGASGTAQIQCPTCAGGYDPDLQEVTFIGFLPAQQSQVSILIKLDKVGRYASETAAPAFAHLVKQLVAFMNIPPDS